MKSFASLLLVAAAAQAHYVYESLIVGGQSTGSWVNVRMTDNHFSNAPVTDISQPTLRCYQAVMNATGVGVSTVPAGSTVGFISNPATYHPGPLSFYMARVPSGQTWDTFDGGDEPVWFKISEDQAIITSSSISWPNTGKSQQMVTIPSCLPAGYYLLRIEQIGLHVASTVGGAQFYISCGQVNVTGGGSGTPGPLVSLPGAYQATDPGLVIDIYYPIPKSYTVPGPRPWTCGA